jgi:hypothetical protein
MYGYNNVLIKRWKMIFFFVKLRVKCMNIIMCQILGHWKKSLQKMQFLKIKKIIIHGYLKITVDN